jgi:hypothetical protein
MFETQIRITYEWVVTIPISTLQVASFSSSPRSNRFVPSLVMLVLVSKRAALLEASSRHNTSKCWDWLRTFMSQVDQIAHP